MSIPTVEWNSASREYGVVNFTNDTDLVVLFYQKSVLDPVQSRQQSMPIHKDVIYVKIFRPGEQMNVIDRPVEEQDKHRFANQWGKFVHNKTQVPEGTPIDLLFPNHPSIADNLRARGIYTIQQCANLTAHAIDSIGMGAQEYVNRARKYIDAAASGESFIKYQEEMKRKDAQIVTLQRQIAEQAARIDALISRMSDPTTKLNPATGTPNPPYIPGYDVQSERINTNHVTTEITKSKKQPKQNVVIDEDDNDAL